MTRLIGVGSCAHAVGTTTTAVNLAVLLARAGHRVLLVDLGEDRAAAAALDAERAHDAPGTLLEEPGGRESLGVLLGDAESPAVTMGALAALSDAWPFIVVDLPALTPELGPTLGHLESVLLTVAAEDFSLKSLAQTFGLITEVKGHHNPDLRIEGVLITLSEKTLQRFEKTMLDVSQNFPADVYPFCIPRDAALSSPPTNGCAVEWAPACRAARGYVELALEVMDRG